MISRFFARLFAIARNISASLLNAGRETKLLLVGAVDLISAVLAVLLSFSVRLGHWQLFTEPVLVLLAAEVAFFVPIFIWLGVYSNLFRFHGPKGLRQLAMACALLTLPSVVVFGFISYPGVPRTVSVLFPLVFFVLVALSRVVARFVLADLFGNRGGRRNVLIYGAGSVGRQLADSLAHEGDFRLIGFIDDDDGLVGRRLEGVAIHAAAGLEQFIADYGIDVVVLAMPGIVRSQRAKLVDRLQPLGVRVLTLPGLSEIIDGKISVSDLRDIDVADLLSRDTVKPDPALMSSAIAGKTVLVTGAGGSIGSELARQIVAYGPQQLVLLEMTESALYLIDMEIREILHERQIEAEIIPELASVEKRSAVERIFGRYRPQTVFHAAAYKHVPLVEANVVSGVTNNIFGTRNCAEVACAEGVERFILVSTDKAVRPTNVMGASKRVCEMICQALAADEGCQTIFSMVRFGNVLGSSGSVVPQFQRQIASGGPVSVTHRDITRFFMTIPEAAELVIQAGAMARGGEVYLLEMGEPVRIFDLALAMIRLSGRTVRDENNPEGDIEVVETGLRPGEKLYEELLIDAEAKATEHERIFRAKERSLPLSRLVEELDELDALVRTGNREEIRTRLARLVPGFQNAGSGDFS